MKYIVEIRIRDGKTQKHICNDFVRERIRTETVEYVKEYWKK